MRFIAIDPGSNLTGVAILSESGVFVFHSEYDDPIKVWHVIDWNYDHALRDDVIVIENFIGGGSRDEHVTRTIKIVGYLENRCREEGYRVYLVNPQARLANVANVPREIIGKDEIAAAAHALSARERWPYL